jgi:hypothetical protein
MTSRKKPRTSIGLISGDPVELAALVHAQLAGGDRIVWVCERGRVYATDPKETHAVAPHNIAGTFRLGAPFEALVEDLECLRESMVKDWILDDVAEISARRIHEAPRPFSGSRRAFASTA